MMRIIAFLFGGNKERLFGPKQTQWVAYTKNGKVVLIEGNQVVKIFDPAKQPEL
jgi:hypothetical protein